MAEESKKIKYTTDKERSEFDEKLFNKVSKEKIMKIEPKDVVLVPISGAFKEMLDDIIHHLMDDMDANQIITSMRMIRRNFKGVEPAQIDPRTQCMWTLMTLTSEITYQAAAQEKLAETDITVGDSVSKLMQSTMEDPPPPSEVFKDQAYMKQVEKNRKEVEKRLKEELKKTKKDKPNEG